VHVTKHPGFVAAIAPAEAQKPANALHQFLFGIQAEAEFGTISARKADVLVEGWIGECLRIAAHVGPVQESKQANRARMIIDRVRGSKSGTNAQPLVVA